MFTQIEHIMNLMYFQEYCPHCPSQINNIPLGTGPILTPCNTNKCCHLYLSWHYRVSSELLPFPVHIKFSAYRRPSAHSMQVSYYCIFRHSVLGCLILKMTAIPFKTKCVQNNSNNQSSLICLLKITPV